MWADWRARRLDAADVEVLATRDVTFGGVSMEARLLRHRVHGLRHHGLVLTPRAATPGCCPVLLEAKGVSWNFFPLRVPGGLNLPGILGPDLARFVLVVPGFRGETIVWDGQAYLSEGDPRDPWDGATDDLLALLNAALTVTPAADASRVGVFGRSRGGTVALLAGLRDPRIRAVAAWAAPTDHFRLMTHGGWTKEEEVRVALRRGAPPREDGGQFIDQFLRPAIDGGAALAAMRHKLLASSPLYFAEQLPATQVHYGLEDSIVPAANGRALAKRLPSQPRPALPRGPLVRGRRPRPRPVRGAVGPRAPSCARGCCPPRRRSTAAAPVSRRALGCPERVRAGQGVGRGAVQEGCKKKGLSKCDCDECILARATCNHGPGCKAKTP